MNSYLPKPAQIPKAKGSFIVIDSESKDLGPTATLTAAALLLVQEKEKTTTADVEVTGSAYLITKDKQASSQSQLLGHASTEASISRVGSASTVNNSATAIHTASTAMLLAGSSETHLTKVSSGKLDEQIRGNKRGRLDTPATTAPAPALKDKNIAASSSSSALAEDVSVVSEKMKALSTAANAVAPDRTNALASTVTPSHTESYPGDTIPLYVRRGAKRTSLASERPASMAAASDSVTAISGLDDVPDEDCNDEGEWGPDTKRNASLLAMSETAAERVTTCAKAGSVAKITGNGKPKGESTASKGSKSLSSCLGRENDSDNADEGDAALDDRDDADAGICNFTKSGYRNSRRCRATKRALLSTSITTQKSEPCLIL